MTGKELRKIRLETLKLTQKELAIALGLSPLRICQIEQDKEIRTQTELAVRWLVWQDKKEKDRARKFKRTIRERKAA